MRDDNCIFCKIANGEIPSATLYEDMDAKAFILAKKIAKKMKDVFGCDGVNIVQNNGVAAGQTVFHFHIHLIPRYEGDHAGVTWKPGTLTDEQREEILQKWK